MSYIIVNNKKYAVSPFGTYCIVNEVGQYREVDSDYVLQKNERWVLKNGVDVTLFADCKVKKGGKGK